MTMTRTFRTASGRKIRVQVSEAEAWRIRAFRLCEVLVPSFWIIAFFRAAGLI